MSRDYVVTRVTSRATPSLCDGEEGEEKVKRSFPMERGSIAKHHSAWNTQCKQKSRKLICPKPKVMPRFSLGNFGEARWLLSHRWTETSSILPDVAHDGRNQNRVMSLSALSLLSACVPARQLGGVHHIVHLAASAESLTTHGRRAQQPTVHLHISDTPVRHARGTRSILCAFVACAAAVQTAVLVRPV